LSEPKIAYYLSFSDVIRVLRLVDETPFQELQLELEGLKVRVVQDKEARVPAPHAAIKLPVSEASPAARPEPVCEQAAAAAVPVTGAEKNGTPVLAPLAGTFYRSPAPGEPPFVDVGAAVKEGDVVGILEIMKLMNHVTAPCSGVIREICAQNEEFVEFGQVLAVIGAERAR
jgi:acetyl-CoA carboxylase biotin carboxyl carrier protein